jgi:hypothetical protein
LAHPDAGQIHDHSLVARAGSGLSHVQAWKPGYSNTEVDFIVRMTNMVEYVNISMTPGTASIVTNNAQLPQPRVPKTEFAEATIVNKRRH